MRYKILACGIAAIALTASACSPRTHDDTQNAPDNLTEPANLALSCQYPEHAPAPSAGLKAFNDYAWQMFVAANWPAKAEARGVPDCNRMIGDSTKVVWISYKTTDETFLPGAVDPGPWESPAKSELEFSEISKVSSDIKDEIMQPVGGWLIDQKNNPVYYQISINKISYDYIRQNDFYNLDTVTTATDIEFLDNSLEVKAAWRWLQADDDHSRYFTRPAIFEVYGTNGKPTGEFKEGVAGLVGLHIIVKAEGFPQWVWATFEQVDNVTVSGGIHTSFYNPNCTGQYCTPNISPEHSGQPFGDPNQLTRVTPLHPEAVAVNEAYQSALKGTPFQYYELVTSQYPLDPQDPGNPMGTPTPNIAANVTLESYIQPTSSCMACHFTARVPGGTLVKTDFSFILLHAQAPANPGDAQ